MIWGVRPLGSGKATRKRWVLAHAVAIAAVVWNSGASAQDAGRGAHLFEKFCTGCHYHPDQDKHWVGPSLHGVVGRQSAGSTFWAYSSAMKRSNWVWTEENLDRWLKNPQAMVPGNKMEFIGISVPEYRADIIAFLKAASK